MTTVEIERTTETKRERERRARLLEAAALEIEAHGWYQYALDGPGGEVCLFGAIRNVSGGADWKVWETVWGIEALSTAWIYADEVHPLAYFNDDIAQESSEVTFLLRWRAQEIRDGR